ncbi:5-hydroxyisourate hydrolase [Balamuthia mandrillaris]
MEAQVSFLNTLSSHVLDTTLGVPAAGLPVTLSYEEGTDEKGQFQWKEILVATTNTDGRVPKDHFPPVRAGTYKMSFNTQAYFQSKGVTKYFSPYVDVVFIVDETGGQHYHVPLLLSPFGYSTYRGS